MIRWGKMETLAPKSKGYNILVGPPWFSHQNQLGTCMSLLVPRKVLDISYILDQESKGFGVTEDGFLALQSPHPSDRHKRSPPPNFSDFKHGNRRDSARLGPPLWGGAAAPVSGVSALWMQTGSRTGEGLQGGTQSAAFKYRVSSVYHQMHIIVLS